MTLAISAIQSAETVMIGNVQVPADCALAKKEHPRLLFTKADLPDIRARIAKPGLQGIYSKLKQAVDGVLEKGPEYIAKQQADQLLVPLGLLYHITGEERYGQACRARTIKAPFGVYAAQGAYGYDLIYNLLSPEERAACEMKMLEVARRGKETSTDLTPLINAVGIWGNGANDVEAAEIISRVCRAAQARKKFLNKWFFR